MESMPLLVGCMLLNPSRFDMALLPRLVISVYEHNNITCHCVCGGLVEHMVYTVTIQYLTCKLTGFYQLQPCTCDFQLDLHLMYQMTQLSTS